MHDSGIGIGIDSGMIPPFLGIGIGIRLFDEVWNWNWNRNQKFPESEVLSLYRYKRWNMNSSLN